MTDAYESRLYAEDIAIGDTGPEVIIPELERKDFVRYAGASGDFNPIHYDEPFAKESGYESVFGQGMLTAGFAAHMISDWFGLDRIRQYRTRFEDQIWPGDTLTVSGEVTDREPTDEGVLVTAAISVTNGDGTIVISGEVTAHLPPRPT